MIWSGRMRPSLCRPRQHAQSGSSTFTLTSLNVSCSSYDGVRAGGHEGTSVSSDCDAGPAALVRRRRNDDENASIAANKRAWEMRTSSHDGWSGPSVFQKQPSSCATSLGSIAERGGTSSQDHAIHLALSVVASLPLLRTSSRGTSPPRPAMDHRPLAVVVQK